MSRGINRRDAIRVTLGLADRVAMEREQQSAIDAARGYAEPWEAPEEAEPSVPKVPSSSRFTRIRERLGRIRLPAFFQRRPARRDGV